MDERSNDDDILVRQSNLGIRELTNSNGTVTNQGKKRHVLKGPHVLHSHALIVNEPIFLRVENEITFAHDIIHHFPSTSTAVCVTKETIQETKDLDVLYRSSRERGG